MAIKAKIPPMVVTYKDIYKLQPMYRAVRKWLIENEFVSASGDPSFEVGAEILYSEKRGTAHNPREKEYRIWWRLKKTHQGASRYYTHYLNFEWYVINQVDMEIMRNGEKLTVQKGEMRLTIDPWIELPDVSHHPILQFIDNYFRTKVIRKNVEEQKKLLYQDAYRLHGYLKRYLELKSFLPVQEDFHQKFDHL